MHQPALFGPDRELSETPSRTQVFESGTKDHMESRPVMGSLNYGQQMLPTDFDRRGNPVYSMSAREILAQGTTPLEADRHPVWDERRMETDDEVWARKQQEAALRPGQPGYGYVPGKGYTHGAGLEMALERDNWEVKEPVVVQRYRYNSSSAQWRTMLGNGHHRVATMMANAPDKFMPVTLSTSDHVPSLPNIPSTSEWKSQKRKSGLKVSRV